MDMVLGSIGQTQVVCEAIVAGTVPVVVDGRATTQDIYDVGAIRIERLAVKPILTRQERTQARVVGPLQTAGIVTGTLKFADGQVLSFTLDEAEATTTRRRTPTPQLGVALPELVLGWDLLPEKDTR